MKEEYKKNVIPVFSDTPCGSGVIVGNLFITAGHLLDDGDVYIMLNGRKILLSKQTADYYEYEGTESGEYVNGMDVAVFRLNENEVSPLVLSEESPTSGEELYSISYLHTISCKNPEESGLFKDITETLELLECHAVVDENKGNYFSCRMEKVLAPGSSGSPVLKGNEVVGILHGGQPGIPVCVFLSSSKIVEKIKSIEK